MNPQNQAPRLKVAFDTSVLGYSRYGAAGRTGVFRMVDAVARGLASADDCSLHFCGAENFQMWVHAKEYLSADPLLAQVPVLSYGKSARVYRFLGKFFWELAQEQELPWPVKVMRRTLQESLRALDHRYEPMEPASIDGMSVFHSPYYPLPESTIGVKGLRRFLTVCDIVNILHPRFGSDGGAYLKRILASLRPEDGVIAISQSTKNDLLNYLPNRDPDSISVAPLAASSDFYPADAQSIQRVRRKFKIPRPYFLSVCTLDRRKNLEGLIEAFALFGRQQSIDDVDLVLCGSPGESVPTIQKALASNGLDARRVHLTGYVDDRELAPLYSGALGFVYPSFYEGFGLPVLEAMQCGTPVITSDRSALIEVAQDAAITIRPESIQELAGALWTLYCDAEQRQILSEKGLSRARQFSWKKTADAILDAYRRPT